MPQFILGYHGMPRRYPNYPPEFQILNVMSTAGASILGLGYLMPVFYLTLSLFFGKKAGGEPVERDRAGVADAQPADDLSTSTSRPSSSAGRTSTRSASIRWAAGLPEPPGPGAPRDRRQGRHHRAGRPHDKETHVVG